MKTQDCPEYALWNTGPGKTCLHCCAAQVQADNSRGCLLLRAAPSTGHDPSGAAYQIFTWQCMEQHNNFMAGVTTMWGTGVKRPVLERLSTSHILKEKISAKRENTKYHAGGKKTSSKKEILEFVFDIMLPKHIYGKKKSKNNSKNPGHLTISLFYPLPKSKSFRKIPLAETLY